MVLPHEVEAPRWVCAGAPHRGAGLLDASCPEELEQPEEEDGGGDFAYMRSFKTHLLVLRAGEWEEEQDKNSQPVLISGVANVMVLICAKRVLQRGRGCMSLTSIWALESRE